MRGAVCSLHEVKHAHWIEPTPKSFTSGRSMSERINNWGVGVVLDGARFSADGPTIGLYEGGVFVQLTLQHGGVRPVSRSSPQTRGEIMAEANKGLMSGELP